MTVLFLSSCRPQAFRLRRATSRITPPVEPVRPGDSPVYVMQAGRLTVIPGMGAARGNLEGIETFSPTPWFAANG